jgi:hypothetical protein
MQGKSGRFSVTKFLEVVDMYNNLPLRVKRDKNLSNEVYYQMLSNKPSGNSQAPKSDKVDNYLSTLLDFVWMKISERFNSLSQAFKFFDVN